MSTVRFGMRRVWLLSRPELIEQVLADRSFVKHYALRMNRRLLGDGLLTSEGDLWLRQRRLMQPAFLRERLAGYGEVMVRYTENMLGRWADGRELELHSEMRRLTMEITAKTLFGADVEGQGPAVAEALREVMESFMSRLFSVFRFSEYLPTPKNLRARRAVERLDAILYGLIAKSRAEGGRDSLLSILLHARDDQDGTGMTDKQLRDEAMTLFLAGHETTALALTYTLRLLALHPDIQARAARRGRRQGRRPRADRRRLPRPALRPERRPRGDAPLPAGLHHRPAGVEAVRTGRLPDPARRDGPDAAVGHAPPPEILGRTRTLPPRPLEGRPPRAHPARASTSPSAAGRASASATRSR